MVQNHARGDLNWVLGSFSLLKVWSKPRPDFLERRRGLLEGRWPRAVRVSEVFGQCPKWRAWSWSALRWSIQCMQVISPSGTSSKPPVNWIISNLCTHTSTLPNILLTGQLKIRQNYQYLFIRWKENQNRYGYSLCKELFFAKFSDSTAVEQHHSNCKSLYIGKWKTKEKITLERPMHHTNANWDEFILVLLSKAVRDDKTDGCRTGVNCCHAHRAGDLASYSFHFSSWEEQGTDSMLKLFF